MMLYHLSIEADRPHHVAEVIAELWGGTVLPFPPVAQGSWIAFAGDDRNTAIEVYPRGTELHEAPGDADATSIQADRRRHSSTHFAMATVLTEREVMAIAEREGWPAKYRKRDNRFGVIELWVEGCLMIEVLTHEMQGEYLDEMSPEGWARILAENAPREPAVA